MMWALFIEIGGDVFRLGPFPVGFCTDLLQALRAEVPATCLAVAGVTG